METRKAETNPADVEEVRQQFESWRSIGRGRVVIVLDVLESVLKLRN